MEKDNECDPIIHGVFHEDFINRKALGIYTDICFDKINELKRKGKINYSSFDWHAGFQCALQYFAHAEGLPSLLVDEYLVDSIQSNLIEFDEIEMIEKKTKINNSILKGKVISINSFKENINQQKIDSNVPDFEPMIIDYDKITWVNSAIDQYCNFEDGYDQNEHTHRIEIKLKNKKRFSIIVKSTMISKYWENYFKSFEKDFKKNVKIDSMVFCPVLKEKIDINEYICMMIGVLFHEDTWSPNGEQFVFTKLGKSISKSLDKEWEYTFSPDVVIRKDEDGYGWDT